MYIKQILNYISYTIFININLMHNKYHICISFNLLLSLFLYIIYLFIQLSIYPTIYLSTHQRVMPGMPASSRRFGNSEHRQNKI